ncbi:SAICAR synthetase family protein [Mycobacterium kansasii 662]|uniref:Phosphoribosylaminoimidazole-succinocarboxamide synthase n=1 Tax=Mycobacterium kansasii 662 TaxID=1299326 RepID=X7YUF9_MYCKA|nr:SAICAR synthetase family protein [Mycobacterium kansasii 662]
MRPALSDYQHLASGKVREIYRIDDGHLLLVATDRISAYDYVLDSTIPDKGRILTAMSVFFFGLVDTPNHLAGPPDDSRIPMRCWAARWWCADWRCFRWNAWRAAI